MANLRRARSGTLRSGKRTNVRFARRKGAPSCASIGFAVIAAAAGEDSCKGHPVLIINRDGGATIKRLFKNEFGGWIGFPDNPTDENRPIYLSDGDRVVGLVRTVHAKVE